MTEKTLTVAPASEVRELDRPMTAQEVVGQVQLIQGVMAAVMKDGEHYGVIPGCGKKPSLLKAGAEKLCLTFRLAPRYEMTEYRDGDHYSVTVRCILTHSPSGRTIGEGLGNCSTRESKYSLRWVDGKRVANDLLADQHNTVLKMGCKRALVAATLNATAASDIFTQDLEDMGTAPAAQARPPIQPPQAKAAPAPAPQAQAAPAPQPPPAAAQAQPAQPPANGPVITDGQKKLVFARWKNSGISEAAFKAFLLESMGIEHRDKIPKAHLDVVLGWLEQNGQDEQQ